MQLGMKVAMQLKMTISSRKHKEILDIQFMKKGKELKMIVQMMKMVLMIVISFLMMQMTIIALLKIMKQFLTVVSKGVEEENKEENAR
jgi:hypothetical protein